MQASIFGYGYYPYMICSLEDAEELQGHWRGIAEVNSRTSEVKLGLFIYMSREIYFTLSSEDLLDRVLTFAYLTVAPRMSDFYLDKIRQSIKDPTSTGFSYKLVD